MPLVWWTRWPDRDRLTEVGHLGHVRSDIVIEGELTSERQQRDARRRELLRGRCHFEDRLRSQRYVVFEIGHPERAAIHGLSIAHDRGRCSLASRACPIERKPGPFGLLE